MRFDAVRGLLGLAVIALSVSGCVPGAGVAMSLVDKLLKPGDTHVLAEVVASPGMNPSDVNGTPSPAVVRIYTLSSLEKFESTEFQLLFDDESVIGADIQDRQGFIIRPKEISEKALKVKSSVETRYFGVIVDFQDDQAQRRASMEIRPRKRNHLQVLLGANSIEVKKKE